MPLLTKARKLARILGCARYRRALRWGVAAAVEHERLLRTLNCKTVVDIGANRGQFALVAARCFPEARIIAFEPLPGPAEKFRRVFAGDRRVVLHQCALGAASGTAEMHVSGRDDSSSLLPITPLQSSMFPGTAECGRQTVQVQRLDEILTAADLEPPALLKLDVQGYELEALRGCGGLLRCFAHVYAECSFVEFYQGQALAEEVFGFLEGCGFDRPTPQNLEVSSAGAPIVGDFLFQRRTEEPAGGQVQSSSFLAARL